MPRLLGVLRRNWTKMIQQYYVLCRFIRSAIERVTNFLENMWSTLELYEKLDFTRGLTTFIRKLFLALPIYCKYGFVNKRNSVLNVARCTRHGYYTWSCRSHFESTRHSGSDAAYATQWVSASGFYGPKQRRFMVVSLISLFRRFSSLNLLFRLIPVLGNTKKEEWAVFQRK